MRRTVKLVIVPVILLVACSVQPSVPASGGPASDSVSFIYEASSDVQVFELDLNSTGVTFSTSFTVTTGWRKITLLQLPLVIEATGKVRAIDAHYNLAGFSGSASFQRKHAFKLQHEFTGTTVLLVSVDTGDELAGFFSGHGFLYSLQVTLTLQSMPLVDDWSCNLTVNPPVLHTFDPLATSALPVAGTAGNVTGEAILQCFPPGAGFTLTSDVGYYFETVFFLDTSDLIEDQSVEIAVRVESDSNYASPELLRVKSLDGKEVYINQLGAEDEYTFTISRTNSNDSVLAFKLTVELTGTFFPEKFVLKPLVKARRKTVIAASFQDEELIFSSIPGSLHLPLIALAISPVGLAGYTLKKEKDREKVERDI